MATTEYTNSILKQNRKVYIDTSALMDVEYLEQLIENMEEDLLTMRKKITVPRSVWMELRRHMEFGCDEKKERAVHAVEIICFHKDIFFIEDRNIGTEEILKAFADKDLLALLIRNKTKCGQLLITNDKKLSRDAFNLNSQESCTGYKISVCYVSCEGQLSACECTKTHEKKDSEITEEKPVEVEPVCVRTKCNWSVIAATSVGSLAVGFLAGKYGLQILRFV